MNLMIWRTVDQKGCMVESTAVIVQFHEAIDVINLLPAIVLLPAGGGCRHIRGKTSRIQEESIKVQISICSSFLLTAFTKGTPF